MAKVMRKWILYSVSALILCLCLLYSPALALDATKAQGTLMDWTLLDDTAGTPTIESNELDSGEGLDASVTAVLHIDMCHADGNAAGTAAGIIVLVKSGTTDEDWHVFLKPEATSGTANVGDCDANSGSGQANVYFTSTTNFEGAGDVFFLKDETTLADSCLVFIKAFANDDYTTSIDDLVNAYDAADNGYDIVNTWNIKLPSTTQAAKVLFYNTDADATYACRIKYTLLTDIE